MKIENVFSSHYANISSLRKRKRHYLETSTVHGIQKILSENNIEYYFWLVVVLIGMTLSLVTAFHSIAKYYSYEVYVSRSRDIVDKHRYPSVTICDDAGLVRNYYAYCGVKMDGTYENPNLTCSTVPPNNSEIRNVLKSKSEWSNGLFHVSACASAHHKFGVRKECVNEKYLKSLSQHDNYCFTWNYAGDFFDESGRVDLTFKLNKSSGYNFSQLFANVHDPRVTELDLKHRIFLDPGKAYQFKVKTVETNRLKHPFPSNCTDGIPNDYLPGKYTRTKCVELTNYLSIIKKCGDIHDYHKRIFPKSLLDKYRKNLTIKETKECFRSFKHVLVNSSDTCPVPCNEFEIITIATFHNMRTSEDNSSYTIEIIRGSEESYSIVEERPLHPWEQIAGEVGGILGVIIGISFVSMIELIVYFVLFVLEKISLCIMYYNAQI